MTSRFAELVAGWCSFSPRIHVSDSTAICICAEQTFAEASANIETFPQAFSTALDAYVKSTLMHDVVREIGEWVQRNREGEDGDKDKDAKARAKAKGLSDIIIKHRLRM
jgi:hypothetical protein